MNNKSKLTQIAISGFKSFGSDELSLNLDLKDVNIIIGTNGAGKSSFISFFEMLNHMSTEALQLYIGKNGGADNILHFGSKKTPIIQSSLTFENPNFKDVYQFKLAKSVKDALIFLEEKIKVNDKEFELDGGQKESLLYADDQKYAGANALKAILSQCRTYQFHDTSDQSHIRNSASIANNRYLFADGGNLPAFLYRIQQKYPKYFERITSRIRYAVPQFGKFDLFPDPLNMSSIKLNWKSEIDNDYLFGPDHLSDGSIRFIALATLFLQPPELLPNIILIDEPELGLHPQVIDLLASMIKECSQYAQIVVATQSPRLLDSFTPDQVIVAETNSASGSSIFKRLNEQDLDEWLENYSLSEIWEKNIIGGQP
ncbi:Predicted ATPase [Fibrobacter intestinalis]|uniref:Predicted ATPase n=3 Tax=Fibrobacteraceae TaxID=204431 RepID=A0A1M6PQ18_9BACT|nr:MULTISPECIES: AAA family ATPase [Fibrobacteraceae]PJJ41134.1 putative ATPase [Hallerella succinigenes]SHK09971.1 Predicted ATPase [Fibrobacter intestinalis]